MDKFLFASNPMSGAGTQAIVHMLNPVTVVQIIQGHTEQPRPYKHYQLTTPTGSTQPLTFVAMHSHAFNEQEEILIDKLFDKAWHWYLAYIKHTEHEQKK